LLILLIRGFVATNFIFRRAELTQAGPVCNFLDENYQLHRRITLIKIKTKIKFKNSKLAILEKKLKNED